MACVRKQDDSSYRVDWRDKKGNRYRKTFALKKEAEDFLTEIKKKMKDRTYVAPKDVPTLREVAELWFANKRVQKLRIGTLSRYRGDLDTHILKADFADARLDAIQAADVEAFRNQLAEKRTNTGSLFMGVTINYTLRNLNGIFVYAMKKQMAAWNPVACVDRVRGDSGEQEQDADDGEDAEDAEDDADRLDGAATEDAVTEDEVLSPADCRKLIDAADDGFDRAFLMTAVMSGARHSELLALQWRDIDFTASTIHVRRNLSWAKLKGEPTRPKFYRPKTGKRGARKIPCPAELALTLKKWRLQCPKGKRGLVFPTSTGQPQHRANTLTRVLRPTLERAGLPLHFHMHTLRHSFCSALIAQGTPPAEVQKYSGHAKLSVLLDTYTHFIPNQQTGCIDRLASQVFGG
jgi:integrase